MLPNWLRKVMMRALYGEPCSKQRRDYTQQSLDEDYGTDTDKQDGWSDREYEINEDNTLPPGRYR